VDHIDRTGPILRARSARAALPQLAHDVRRERPRGGDDVRGDGIGEGVAATPRERVRADCDVGAGSKAGDETRGDFADAGAVTQERCAVERDTEGVDAADTTEPVRSEFERFVFDLFDECADALGDT